MMQIFLLHFDGLHQYTAEGCFARLSWFFASPHVFFRQLLCPTYNLIYFQDLFRSMSVNRSQKTIVGNNSATPVQSLQEKYLISSPTSLLRIQSFFWFLGADSSEKKSKEGEGTAFLLQF
jgi:hypothetical protein